MFEEKQCYFDSKRGLLIHCFPPGKCRCRCGKRILRRPVLVEEESFIFGKKGDGYVVTDKGD